MTTPNWTMRSAERSSGLTSPRFSCHSRIGAFSSTRVAKMPYLLSIDVLRAIAVPPNRRRHAPLETIFDHVKRMPPALARAGGCQMSPPV